jgi:hypothetical protein
MSDLRTLQPVPEVVATSLRAAGIPLVKVGKCRGERFARAEREFYVWILRRFSEAGAVPGEAARAEAARLGLDFDTACDQLVAEGLVHFDADGSVAVAYPFSGRPTSHRVVIDGQSVHAMCAIDALGIAPMFDRTVVVTSRDPITQAEIKVSLQPEGTAQWQPEEAVVVVGRCCDGKAFEGCCQVLNFFASTDSAERYLRDRAVEGFPITIPQAIEVGRAIFGDVLKEA